MTKRCLKKVCFPKECFQVKLDPKIIVLLLAASCSGSTFAQTRVALDAKGDKWAKSTLRKMTLEEKVGQLIMPWARVEFMNTNSPQLEMLREEMHKYHVGGFGMTVFTENGALLKSEPLEAAALTNDLQRHSKYPLLMAADFERGLAMRLNGATGFPAAMAFGATGDANLARQFGKITAEEARAVGIQWNWFPVADVNSNPANPIINTRSFGEDPAVVGGMVAAYIDGARSKGLLTTVKHFPGHGDTDTDSHLTLARSTASVDRLNSLELVPFRAAIAAGVDSVMTAHLTVPSIEPDPDRPASISYKVVTGLLKDQLGFRGLVVTDALDMGALTRVFPGDAAQVSAAEAVAAIQAGNDMVIIPADLKGAYDGLLDAVRRGTISQERINQSVLKVLRMKASAGLNRDRLVDLGKVTEEVAKPASLEFAAEVADRAVTLLKNSNQLLPLQASRWATSGSPSGPAKLVAVIFTDDARSSEGARAIAYEIRRRVPGATIEYVDNSNSAYVGQDVLLSVAGAETVIAVAEAFPSARRVTAGQTSGSAGLGQGAADLLAGIVQSAGDKTIVGALGNPYIGTDIPGLQSYLCTFSNTGASAKALIAAVFGEIAIQGHTPVTIPGIAKRGEGIMLPAVH
jgi:beta-N-acetylhexosaminidase